MGSVAFSTSQTSPFALQLLSLCSNAVVEQDQPLPMAASRRTPGHGGKGCAGAVISHGSIQRLVLRHVPSGKVHSLLQVFQSLPPAALLYSHRAQGFDFSLALDEEWIGERGEEVTGQGSWQLPTSTPVARGTRRCAESSAAVNFM